jgi:four helix bundle protein
MTPEEMKERTKAYALRVIRLTEALPPGRAADILGRQLLRAATSVGANYRAACRARSQVEFVAKMGIVEEEADESVYWLELLSDSGIMKKQRLAPLMREGEELLRIAIASIRTARKKSGRTKA